MNRLLCVSTMLSLGLVAGVLIESKNKLISDNRYAINCNRLAYALVKQDNRVALSDAEILLAKEIPEELTGSVTEVLVYCSHLNNH
jgi:hypothetical protein